MGEAMCENALCTEKFKIYDKEIDELKVNLGKLTERVNEVDKKTDNLESTLTGKLLQIEQKFDIYNGMTFKKLEELERKIDKLTSSEMALERKKDEDSFKDWLQTVGIKVVEYAIYGGVLYGIAKGIKLF